MTSGDDDEKPARPNPTAVERRVETEKGKKAQRSEPAEPRKPRPNPTAPERRGGKHSDG